MNSNPIDVPLADVSKARRATEAARFLDRRVDVTLIRYSPHAGGGRTLRGVVRAVVAGDPDLLVLYSTPGGTGRAVNLTDIQRIATA